MLKKTMLACALAITTLGANAEIVSFGDLATDANYHIVADTKKGREYLRLDAFDLTYAQTVSATQVGGIYEGWSIAGTSESDDFINALFSQDGENPCSTGVESHGETCGGLSGWYDGAFGASYLSSGDHWAFLSSGPQVVGLGYINSTGAVTDYNSWAGEVSLDSFSGENPINLLLYRENAAHLGGFNAYAVENNLVTSASDVTSPFAAGALLLSLAGMGFRRKA